MDRDRERDRDRRFVKPTAPYARQRSSSATQCTHHAHARQRLTFRAETTATRTHTGHARPVLAAALLVSTATARGHQRVAAPPRPGEALRPAAAWPPPTHILPEGTAALLGPGAARRRSGGDRAARAETTIGEPDRARRRAATSRRAGTTTGTTALARPGETATIPTPARPARATGHHRPGPAKLRPPEAAACARLCAQAATMSRARASTGMQTCSRQMPHGANRLQPTTNLTSPSRQPRLPPPLPFAQTGPRRPLHGRHMAEPSVALSQACRVHVQRGLGRSVCSDLASVLPSAYRPPQQSCSCRRQTCQRAYIRATIAVPRA